ncbi:hypothetical protein C8R46DRAFT_1322058 [Mycena filopes]|nr:hypothetical protein C8R46DRAFT_1322058 [Mycena filopes]
MSSTAFVDTFFQWKPPKYEAAPDHTASKGTRPPAPWDMHLDDELILKKIKFLPSLQTSLRDIAELALHRRAKDIPPCDRSRFPTDQVIARTYERMAPIREEADLTRQYESTIGSFCAMVAATLECKHEEWDTGFLQWTVSPSKRHGHGIADGFLRMVARPPRGTRLDATSERVSKLKQQAEDVALYFPDLSVWEFKSLKVIGAREPMQGIIDLAATYGRDEGDNFPWVGCPFKASCWHTHRSPRGGPIRTGAPTGPDCNAPRLGINLSLTKVPTAPATLSVGDAQNVRHLVQQTWAEGVRTDATFLVIHSGNYEIIGLRHRGKQTLYISDIIEGPSQDRYAQIQTGLFIAIMRDARRRAKSLRLATTKPPKWIKYYDGESDSSVPTLSPREQQEQKQASQVAAVGEAFIRPIVVFTVTPAKTNTVHFAFRVDTPYYRPEYAIPFEFEDTPKREMPLFTVVVQAKNLDPVTPKISFGTILVDGQVYNPSAAYMRGLCTFPKHTIIKCAQTEGDVARLWKESAVCDTCEELGVTGIPESVGYFRTDETEQLPRAVLLLSDCGKPANIPELLMLQKQAFIGTLRLFHRSGYIHGNLQPRKLLLDADGEPKIVGFGHARRQASLLAEYELERARELKQLKCILDITGPTRPPTPTPIRLDLVRIGPFNLTDRKVVHLREIFESATSWLNVLGYFPGNQVDKLHLTNGPPQDKHSYIAVQFATQKEVDRFTAFWTQAPMPKTFEGIHLDVWADGAGRTAESLDERKWQRAKRLA